MSISKTKRRLVYKRDGWKCLKCGTGKNLTIDHIVPLSLGGHNGRSNLQTLCECCNFNKGATMISYRRDNGAMKSINKYIHLKLKAA
jgi:5-methylcytosine-specific restriction endonuclease McrA